jgi:pimeloyl-ACP methyl ester carboxylesterase
VDLVGHDWGGILVARLALTRPDLIRTWVTDAIAIFDPSAEWHDLAKLWQTPGQGEEFMSNMESMPQDQRAALLAGAGMPESFAQVAAEPDPEMNRSILTLYRSATQVNRDWGEDLQPTQRPGLMVLATGDAYASTDIARAQSERLGLAVHELDGLGHWWMVQDPERAAGMLREFWAGAS